MPGTLLGVVVVLVVGASAAIGASDAERLQRRMRKYAPEAPVFAADAKSLCACQESGFEGWVGVLEHSFSPAGAGTDVIDVGCKILVFDAAGQQAGTSNCNQWVPLAK